MSTFNINEFLAKHDGTIPGGCDQCDAEQTLRNENGMWRITIAHDDWCPFLKAFQKRQRKAARRNGRP